MTVSPMTRTDAAAELAGLQRTSRIVNRAVWGVAVGVMVYGAGNVTGLLISHGVHPAIAWMLSPMVDLGLVVALVGGRALDGYGVRAGWLTVLRWTAGLMTWSLNTAGPFLHPGGADAVGVLIHSCGPVLLLVVAEAAASIQRGIATAAARLHRQADPAPAPAPAPGPDPVRPSALSSPRSSTAPPVPAAAPVAAGPARPSAGKATPTARSAGVRRAVSPADVDELLPLGWRIAADHDARGVRLTRDRLREAIRQTGQSISTDRAGRLLARLRTDPPSDPGPSAPVALPAPSAESADRAGKADRPAAPADRTDRTTALTEAGDLHG